jgi:hypothetical protein
MAVECKSRAELAAAYGESSKSLLVSWQTLRTRLEQAAAVRAQLVAEITVRLTETMQQEVSERRVVAIEEFHRRRVVQSAVTTALALLRFFAAEAHDRRTIQDFFEYERWNMTDVEMLQRQQILDAELSPFGTDTEADGDDDHYRIGAPSSMSLGHFTTTGPSLRAGLGDDRQDDDVCSSIDMDEQDGDFSGKGNDDNNVFANHTFRHDAERREVPAKDSIKVYRSYEVPRAVPPETTLHTELGASPYGPGRQNGAAVVSKGGLVVHGNSFMAQYPPVSTQMQQQQQHQPPWRSSHVPFDLPPVSPPPRRGPQHPKEIPPSGPTTADLTQAEESARTRLEALEAHMMVELLKYDAESLLLIEA